MFSIWFIVGQCVFFVGSIAVRWGSQMVLPSSYMVYGFVMPAEMPWWSLNRQVTWQHD